MLARMAAARLKLSWMMLPISAPGHPGIVPALDVAEDGKKEADMNPNISADQSASNKKLNFRCADVGPKNCDWQVSGDSEQEIMPKIEQHGREQHNLTIDDATRNKVRNAIQRRAA